MICGFDGHENSPRYRPPPSFCNVPINCPVDSTRTVKVAFELVLVASTLSNRLLTAYSALCMDTVSVVCAGETVNVAVRVTPPWLAEIVTDADAETV